MRPTPAVAPIGLCLSLLVHPGCTRSAVRVDPLTGILDAFRSHQIVALGEGIHGNLQAHAVRLALVRDPRFAAVVNDIVVEFGSARHQTAMDRFVGGDDVPYAELRKAWQDTTTAHRGWDLPICEQFFRAVREANATLPADRRLRVLLGEPPIDWSTVRTREDLGRWLARRGGDGRPVSSRGPERPDRFRMLKARDPPVRDAIVYACRNSPHPAARTWSGISSTTARYTSNPRTARIRWWDFSETNMACGFTMVAARTW